MTSGIPARCVVRPVSAAPARRLPHRSAKVAGFTASRPEIGPGRNVGVTKRSAVGRRA